MIATSFQDPAQYPVIYALDARSGRVRWQSRQECYDGSCGPFPATVEGGDLNLFEEDNQTNVIRLLTIDVTSGQKLAQQSWHVLSPGNNVGFVGIDSGRVYVLAKGNEHTLDVIHALSLTNGADLWSYQIENYASGSIETPIVAP